MKLLSKISILALSVTASVILSASGGYHYERKNHENLEDAVLNNKLVEVKHKINTQKAGPTEAGELFAKVFPGPIEGSAKVNKVWFEDGDTSLVITDSPIPMKLIFKNQFLMDSKALQEKIGKTVKFKITDYALVEEPILETLRKPVTDSPYWIHATFSNSGKVKDADFIDSIKSGDPLLKF